jgi:predicted metal-dependent hydrolase
MDLPEDVEIRRSSRRRRTLQARREGDKIVVLVPAQLAARDYEQLVLKLVQRVRAREAGGKRSSDAALERAAHRLVKELGADLNVLPRLTSVSWSTRQNHRWGSCTTTTGEIRLSSRLQSMPDWVIDYVLFHELVHLEEASHSPRFRDLVRRYPDHDRAVGFLHGVAFALATPGTPWPSDIDRSDDSSDREAQWPLDIDGSDLSSDGVVD